MGPSLDVTFIREAYQMRRLVEINAVPDLLGRLGEGDVSEWIDWHIGAGAMLPHEDGSDLSEFLRDVQPFD
ncbi:hypothetical protein [Pseudorhizobium marinum]|uniref:hypothetical protein n=1 Tax=Pseudorhizobium marinum TaxID=1496690 RepID=UPI000AFE0385|nr:hypothetical protein [Pseudorhizobium marinum]